jgi:succinate dehydrogenase/fumarate reductase flavoprotein subunit
MGRSLRVARAGDVTWDDAHDVVVVGAGAAGLPTALNAARNGSDVIVLEKAPEAGGTMLKSAAWYWIPNNSLMQRDGKTDDKEGFLRYWSRLARPQTYNPDDERLGMTEWEYETAAALFDNASRAHDTLVEMGVFTPLYAPAIPDYHSTLPENTAPYGRTLMIDRGDGEMGKGDVLSAQLLAACERAAVPVLCDHMVEAVVVDEDDAVVGVRVAHNGSEKHISARQAVVFASGGFTHNEELRKNFLPAGVAGGCAAPTNEGDFVHIATALGVPLRNMNFAWFVAIPFEIALQKSPYLSGMFSVPGDSMIWVDKYGRRVVNEKTIYNELALSFFGYDPAKLEYPRMLMFMIWDQRTADVWQPVHEKPETTPPRLALDNYGNIVYDDFHLIKGETLDELGAGIEARLAELASHTGGFSLDRSFRKNLAASVKRFNKLAASGKDTDFHRGENPIELIFNGPERPGNDTGNPTMYPFSETGPYYATIVSPGTLDTKGGPVTNTHGQVLDVDGEPVPGLYAVGNCVASASGQAYVAGGGTIGPYFTFAYLAAEHATSQPRREVGVAVG